VIGRGAIPRLTRGGPAAMAARMRVPRRLAAVAIVTVLVLGAAAAQAYWDPGPQPSRTIKCESKGGRYTYCRTGAYGPVRLERQLSATRCVAYDTWGADADGAGVWVANGCRATFLVGGGWGRPPQSGGPPRHGGPPPGGRTVACKSEGFSYTHCRVGRIRDARVEKNLSDTRCRRDDNWGIDRGGIWVDRGCAARFLVY